METYKPNSDKARNNPDVMKVNNNVVEANKTFGQKVKSSFIKGDFVATKNYLIYEVLIPAVTNTVIKGITTGLQMIFLGKANATSNDNIKVGNVSYRNYYDSPLARGREEITAIRGYAFDTLAASSELEAKRKLDDMYLILEQKGYVLVSDYYETFGYVTDNYMSGEYGWYGLKGSKIVPTTINGEERWAVIMPDCIYINARRR